MSLLLLGCLSDGNDSVAPGPDEISTPPTKDEITIENSYITRDAVEAFAAANGGLYPLNSSQRIADGRQVVDFLPGGQLLVNPYTGSRTSPSIGSAAGSRGQTGYVTHFDTTFGLPLGYTIDCWNEDFEIVLQIFQDPND